MTQSLDEELVSYLGELPLKHEAIVGEYWKTKAKTYPILFKIAMVLLAIPVTQVTVERLFSSLKFILSCRRTSISEKLLRATMLVRENFGIKKFE